MGQESHGIGAGLRILGENHLPEALSSGRGKGLQHRLHRRVELFEDRDVGEPPFEKGDKLLPDDIGGDDAGQKDDPEEDGHPEARNGATHHERHKGIEERVEKEKDPIEDVAGKGHGENDNESGNELGLEGGPNTVTA